MTTNPERAALADLHAAIADAEIPMSDALGRALDNIEAFLAAPRDAALAYTPSDLQIAELVNALTQVARIFHDHQSLRQRISFLVTGVLKGEP